MTKEQQKQEAILRLKSLNLHSNVMKDFNEGLINKSDPLGILFWLNDEEKAFVKQFEEQHNAIVYHVIHSYTGMGEMYSLFFVSQYEEEWGYDKDDLKEYRTLAYVWNKDCEWCSEFGSIGFKSQNGGLVRTW